MIKNEEDKLIEHIEPEDYFFNIILEAMELKR